MPKNIKTNAMRILDSNKIEYKQLILDITEALDGVTCASMLGVDSNYTFKTLVTKGKSNEHYVFVVPVAKTLDLKKAALTVNEKNIEMIHQKELLGLTGYIHGGCSPIGMKKVFKTVVDKSALNYNKIIFSGGKIGFFIEVSPLELEKVIPVTFDEIVGD